MYLKLGEATFSNLMKIQFKIANFFPIFKKEFSLKAYEKGKFAKLGEDISWSDTINWSYTLKDFRLNRNADVVKGCMICKVKKLE